MFLQTPDFTELFSVLAQHLKIKPVASHLSVNSKNGKGFCWTEKLPCGITLLVSDTTLNESIEIERPEMEERHFVLQFNEEMADETNNNLKKKRDADELESFVRLNYTLKPQTFIFPAAKRLRSVKFFFTEQHLFDLLGKEVGEQIAGQYFPQEINNAEPELITSEYRGTLNDLWAEKVDHPLRINFIQNRVLLLIEKYVLKLHENKQVTCKKLKRTSGETHRLIDVGVMLLKDFTVPAPTIKELSRKCAMSPTKLKTNFKSVYGMPIYEYFQRNRMQKAKSLLLKKQHNITQVGNMVGYSNLSHFATAFKKQFNCLPSEIGKRRNEDDGIFVY